MSKEHETSSSSTSKRYDVPSYQSADFMATQNADEAPPAYDDVVPPSEGKTSHTILWQTFSYHFLGSTVTEKKMLDVTADGSVAEEDGRSDVVEYYLRYNDHISPFVNIHLGPAPPFTLDYTAHSVGKPSTGDLLNKAGPGDGYKTCARAILDTDHSGSHWKFADIEIVAGERPAGWFPFRLQRNIGFFAQWSTPSIPTLYFEYSNLLDQ
jgi:hypothetical protein